MQEESTNQSFSWAHFTIVGLCAFILIALVVFKSGFNFDFLKQNKSTPDVVTYEEVREKIKQANNNTLTETDAEYLNDMVSLLDPGSLDPQVLGIMDEIPTIDEYFPAESMDLVKVKSVKNNSAEAIQKYKNDLSLVEMSGEALQMMLLLNSDDPKSLEQVRVHAENVIYSLGAIEVPEVLIDFHRYKLLYYYTLGQVATSLSVGDTGESFAELSTLLFSIAQKIESMQANF